MAIPTRERPYEYEALSAANVSIAQLQLAATYVKPDVAGDLLTAFRDADEDTDLAVSNQRLRTILRGRS